MRILLLRKKNVCYDSYLYFSKMVQRELEAMGCDVTPFIYDKDNYDALESLCGGSFDAILDFNSMLPRMILDDDTRLLDHIEGAFFDFILDHPLYHQDSLSVPIRDFHVICLDRNHKAYIQEQYPHIASVDVIGTTGSVACGYDEKGERDIDILFTGTYTDIDDVRENLDGTPRALREYSYALIEMMERDTTLPLEKAVDRLIKISGDEVMAENKALHVQAFFLVDTYMRAKIRADVIRTILDAGLSLTLCGDGWEKMTGLSAKSIMQVDYDETFALMARSKITLNIMPCFKDGVHDRVYASMMNGSLCVTDPSDMLKEQFADGENIVFYSASELNKLPDKLGYLLNNKEKRTAIANAGRIEALKHHTWKHRVAELARVMKI